MNSVVADQSVATTGLPSSIASAATRPKPSLRCSDTTMSTAAVKRQGRGRRQRVGDHANIGSAGRGRELCEVLGGVMRISDLQNKHPVRARAERHPEGFDRAERILPHERRGEVEGRECDHGLGRKVEIGATKRCRGKRIGGYRRRHHRNRHFDQRRHAQSAVNCDGAQTLCTKLAPSRQSGGATGSSQYQ